MIICAKWWKLWYFDQKQENKKNLAERNIFVKMIEKSGQMTPCDKKMIAGKPSTSAAKMGYFKALVVLILYKLTSFQRK